MATLQKIRNKAGVLVAVVIGLALFAFILGDFLKSGRSLSSDSQFEIANVRGVSISYQEYDARVNKLIDNAKRNSQKQNLDEETIDQIKEQAWQSLIMDYVMQADYEDLGLDVCPDELFDMVQGKNIDPSVKQIPIFKNQQTGQFDRSLVIRFLKNLDKDQTGNARASWLAFEQSLQTNKKMIKYNFLIKKGLLVPDFMIDQNVKEKNNTVDFKYIVQNYKAISDSDVTYSEQDLQKYYDEHKNKFEQEASRDIEYVTFDVIPSKDDSAKTLEWIQKIIPEFKESTNDIQYVSLNSDIPVKDYYYSKGELSPIIDSIMFANDTGYVYGPYFEDGYYKTSKISQIKNMSDSVKARHILIQPNENLTYEKANNLADSLLNVIKNGGNFIDIAQKYSADKASLPDGGDIGWFKQGQMVKPFEKACFNGKKGDIVKVETQYGIHIIEIEDKSPENKKILVTTVARQLLPSSDTYQKIFGEASKFAGTYNTSAKFDTAIINKGYTKRIAANIKEIDKKIAGLENPRELVRWTFKAQKNDVSPVIELGNRFVIAKITDVREKGIAPFEQVKTIIEPIVIKDKKAEKIKQTFVGTDLKQIAQKLNLDVKEAENISFATFAIPGAGIEPVVIGVATNTAKDVMSKPIKGNNGVYQLVVTNTKETKSTTKEQEKKILTNDFSTRVDYQAYEALKKAADIKDERAKFF